MLFVKQQGAAATMWAGGKGCFPGGFNGRKLHCAVLQRVSLFANVCRTQTHTWHTRGIEQKQQHQQQQQRH